MSRPLPLMFELQQLVNDMALIDRNHFILGTDRSENDIEHTFAVTMMCWFVMDKYKIPLSKKKVLKYALAHDFAERYVGDVNTFASEQDRSDKELREKLSIETLKKEFHDFPALTESLVGYENKVDDEALFVWTIDKMQAIILADMDNWRPYERIGITYDQFVEKHNEHMEKGSVHCKEIFKELLDYCKTTFYDRPSRKLL